MSGQGALKPSIDTRYECAECGYRPLGPVISTNVPMLDTFLRDIADELEAARATHAPMNSDHEAYAVILEELDEYKLEVWKKRAARNRGAMYRELVQIATMATRAALDLYLERQVG